MIRHSFLMGRGVVAAAAILVAAWAAPPAAAEETAIVEQAAREICADRSEADRANAELVLRHFTRRGAAPADLSIDALSDDKAALICRWTPEWKTGVLFGLSDAELALVWRYEVVVQAAGPAAYEARESLIAERLARIEPSVEAELPEALYVATEEEREAAILDGRLAEVSFEHIHVPVSHFLQPEFFARTTSIDVAMADATPVFQVSSTTRSIAYQRLLRKLVFVAARSSFHNAGLAIDLSLTDDGKALWDAALRRAAPDGSGRDGYAVIGEMIEGGAWPTVERLIAEGVVEEDDAVAVAYRAVLRGAADAGLAVIDETPFYILFDEATGLPIRVNIVLHIQPSEPSASGAD